MEIIFENSLKREDVLNIQHVAEQCDITFDTARLLHIRKIDTVEKAKTFLNPSKNNFISPFEFKDMQKVVDRISLAKDRNEKILIFGDYDADGICASSILYYCLKDFGINAMVMIPEREDGYGLNLEKITNLKNTCGLDLIITVDCGISDVDAIRALKAYNVDVIVTDHHEPPEILPDTLIINPKVKSQNYPFDGLCGAGVAYKVGNALIGNRANDYLDFVALATVADSMSLISENRDLVYEGLKLFSPSKIRPSFKNLLGDVDKAVTSSTLAFSLAPKVNAGGRMGDANSALNLFLSTKEQEIYDIAVKLNAYNLERQAGCDKVYKEAKTEIIKQRLFLYPVICVKGEDWNAGVIGIVAAKLVEDFNRPVIVFSKNNDYLKGSARSIDGVNVFNLISIAKDFLITFGGHAQAAGVSLYEEHFERFCTIMSESMKTQYSNLKIRDSICVDWQITNPVSIDFAREIDRLEPFGIGNKKPCFVTEVGCVDSSPLRPNSPHYSFDTDVISMLDFNGEKDVFALNLSTKTQVVFEVNYSIFHGREQVKGFVKKVVPEYGDFSDLTFNLFRSELNLLLHPAGESEDIEFNPNLVELGYGTMYAISDVDNLNNYEIPESVPIYPFNTQGKSANNCIVVCPTSVPEEYQKVVYLDTPIQTLTLSIPTFKVSICGYEHLDFVDTSREYFAEVFNYLCSLVGERFVDSAWAYNNYEIDFDGFSFVFCAEVFLELGFFEIRNGVLCRNTQKKNPLTNSVIYSKICSIKGDLC